MDVSGAVSTVVSGIMLSTSGVYLNIADRGNNRLIQYTMSTPHDLTTATQTHTYSLSGTPDGIVLDRSNRNFYVTIGTTIEQWNISVEGSIETVLNTIPPTLDVSAQDSTPGNLVMEPEGEGVILVGRNTNTLYEYTIPTFNQRDIASATYSGTSLALAGISADQIAWYNEGFGLLVTDTTDQKAVYIELATAYTLTGGATQTTEVLDLATNGNRTSIAFEGVDLYLGDASSNTIRRFR